MRIKIDLGFESEGVGIVGEVNMLDLLSAVWGELTTKDRIKWCEKNFQISLDICGLGTVCPTVGLFLYDNISQATISVTSIESEVEAMSGMDELYINGVVRALEKGAETLKMKRRRSDQSVAMPLAPAAPSPPPGPGLGTPHPAPPAVRRDSD